MINGDTERSKFVFGFIYSFTPLMDRYLFSPVALETFCSWGKEAIGLINKIGKNWQTKPANRDQLLF